MKTYTCERCGGVFRKRSDAEANAEALALWGVPNASERSDVMAQICDKCFVEFHAWLADTPKKGTTS